MRNTQLVLLAAVVICGGNAAAIAQIDPASASVGVDRASPGSADSGVDIAERVLNASDRANRELHAPPSPGDSDLGEQLLLVPQSTYEPWTLFGSAGVFFTDNAALEEAADLIDDDVYFTAEAGVTYLPRVSGNLFAELSARYKTYQYDDRSDLSFDSLRTDAGLINIFRDFYDISIFGSYTYRRLTDRDFDEFYRNHSIIAGVFVPVRLGPNQSAYVSALADFSLSGGPDTARRHEYSGQAGYIYRPLEILEFDVSYRFSYLDFTEVGRADINQYVGAGVTLKPAEWVELSLTGGYSTNDSDLDGADYDVGTVGGSLSVTMKF